MSTVTNNQIQKTHSPNSQPKTVRVPNPSQHSHHLCPPWVGRLLASPLRKLAHNPQAILTPYLSPGMKALDVGCALGFFTMPMAEIVGPDGQVIAIDVQPEMLGQLDRRIAKTNLRDRIQTHHCTVTDLGLSHMDGQLDFVLAFHVIHEAPDPEVLLTQLHKTLRPGGCLLMCEPRRHVSAETFASEVEIARWIGFRSVDEPHINISQTMVFRR